ncbi:hypothetical protein HCN44_003622 [Aphidius gifuensis]|uniref:Uncharacterized protein n=1 Tax=Aphidius gifuensis TaxID=684658 RepID=A0A834XM01_APHGI|nr:uncharacterized protein LOC122858846 isoform X1 [Aphidius gifuensis]KAF7987759.1 hypothetical protein HCN44_003622 [Aphidius gifuensis]
MASQVAGILESIHSIFRPILSKIEVNSFFGILDLRVGAIIIAIIQLVVGCAGLLDFHIPMLNGIFSIIVGVLLIISAVINQRVLTIPWLILMFIFEFFLIVMMVINLLHFKSEFPGLFLENLFLFLFYLIGYSIVYSFYMKMNDLPTVNPA